MYNFKEKFPEYDVDENGTVYKNGKEIIPFKSNDYLQVLLFDVDHKRCVLGVHTVVAMKYLEDYTDGCIVHHKDENKHNNNVNNLEVFKTKAEHIRLHNKNNRTLANYTKIYGPHNKGKKMSEDFCRHCSESAKKRGFTGNQYVDKNGNPR